MPNNAVQRLQEIENDIKTVISLYEVANKSKTNDDKPKTPKKQNSQQLPQISASKRLEATTRFDKFREVPGKPQTSLFDTVKETSGVVTQPSEGLNPRESMLGKKWTQNKPGSAPSSPSTINILRESDFPKRQSSGGDGALEKRILGEAKKKRSDDLNNLKWFKSSDFQEFDAVMSPSKTLQTANEILAKNNFHVNEGSGENERSVHCPNERGREKSSEELTVDLTLEVKKSCSSKKVVFDLKNRKKEKTDSEMSCPSSVPENISVEFIMESNVPITQKSCVTESAGSSKEKLLGDIGSKYSAQKEIQKTRSSGTQKTAKSTTSKQLDYKNTKCDESIQDNNGKDDNKKDGSKLVLPKETNKILVQEKDKTEEEKSPKEQTVVQISEPEGSNRMNQQRAVQSDGEKNETELWVSELSKIIEKGNEKLERMKMSKELALDIANHFKEKYDEIQKSKGELLEKLQMVEKNNEELNTEAKLACESKDKLQQKTEDTTQKVMKVQPKYAEEITSLKAKLWETEKEFNAKLLEKNKIIEDMQMNRLIESRKGLKNQEILAKKLQRLTNEKCELLSKFDDLRRQLHNSQSTAQTLEENIHQLEEEVQKQKQHLKIKTETLHETNRELEMIRLNCSDLEDQVKMLRKNIEEFDGIQHSLIRKTTEYEQQIKSNQEKMKELQDENVRLKKELDNEKDGLRIKVKIIEDQQQTIRQLKEKSEDAKTLLKRNQSLERILKIEREEKVELQEALQRLKWRKEELKQKVKTLQNDYLLAPQEVVRDLQKTQIVLHELENQVQRKQKEWELQLHSLIKEKQQACSVAEFATKKLMETRNEFQKQSVAYKGLQTIVAKNLASKEKQYLREANKRVSGANTRLAEKFFNPFYNIIYSKIIFVMIEFLTVSSFFILIFILSGVKTHKS